jgi:hypothetical protein
MRWNALESEYSTLIAEPEGSTCLRLNLRDVHTTKQSPDLEFDSLTLWDKSLAGVPEWIPKPT